MMNRCAVTVVLLTYNHVKYVAQALDSVLCQKTNFDYQILIGDDCSGDGTREILKDYAKKYKEKIHLILRKQNIGATNNVKDLIARANGKYIAFLETDDYWCCEDKLQKQYDFMESHPEYSGCGHQCNVVNENGELIPEKNNRDDHNYWYFSKSVYDIHDFELAKAPGQLASLFCRNYWLQDKRDLQIISYAHYLISDKTILMLLLSKGNIFFMDEILHCYRLVENKGNNNFKSMARSKNLRYEEYKYFCIIEEFANARKQMNMNLSPLKKDKLICASAHFVKNSTLENFLVVLRMILEKNRVFTNSYIVLKTLLLKSFYIYILKQDRPVYIK